MDDGNSKTIEEQRVPLELSGIEAENSRIVKEYFAFDMPNDRTYIGHNRVRIYLEYPIRDESLEDIVVTSTVSHLFDLNTKATDIVKHYISAYREAMEQLPAEALRSQNISQFDKRCVACWYLGNDILQ